MSRKARRRKDYIRALQARRKARVEVYQAIARRDGCRCHYCPEMLSLPILVGAVILYVGNGPQATIDHLIPKSKGGSEKLANKVLACRPCNAKKGSISYHEYLIRRMVSGVGS